MSDTLISMVTTGNATLTCFTDSLTTRIRLARYRVKFSYNWWDQTVSGHGEILDALTRRNGQTLAQIFRTHLQNSCQTVKAALDKDEGGAGANNIDAT